ncbi:hypothetical protein M0R89_04430 [Halorussus limi]|uniref:Nucleotidyltransferase domain-containing protein n=1 Tax=Halorussus limi TaxID=2938695 RepID=A0A8U0HXE5_9EURY|nr:hypothetical protein [Halorussus limi]UPV75316.1 hypothetical protein M0R89_04430 [Halorussus limi]
MRLSETNLRRLRDLCLEHYREEESNIRSIILYGGAAKNFVGDEHEPGDFDLNVFFSDQASISSTHGRPEIIGEYDDLEVEVMRNRVPDGMSVRQYVEAQDSKRWRRIREEPIVCIYPGIKRETWE